MLLKSRSDRLGQLESGNDIRDDRDIISDSFSDEFFSVRLVRKGQDGIGMRVIDESLRNDSVDRSFDGWKRASTVEQLTTHFRSQPLVIEIVEPQQWAESIDPDGHMLFW